MVSCGANADDDPGPTANSFYCTFPDGDASTIVNVTANDGAAEDDDPHTVNILNVAPVITGPTGAASVNEGDGTHLYSFSFTDPGADTWTPSASCGTNGTPSDLSSTTPPRPARSSAPGADDPTGAVDDVTVSITVNDGDGGSDTNTATVTVFNVAPVITGPTGAASVNEGDGTHLYSFSFTDPGADTWTPSASCGTNGTPSDLALDDTTKTGSFKCAWSDDPTGAVDDVTVSITVNDGDGGSDTNTATVTVFDVAPVITGPTGAASVNEGDGTHLYSFSFTDPGADTWTPSASCGTDGTLSDLALDDTTKTGSFKCAWSMTRPARSTTSPSASPSTTAMVAATPTPPP